jgi:hypothetical protein
MAAERIARALFDLAGLSVTGTAGPGRLAVALFHGEENIEFASQCEPVIIHRKPPRLFLRTGLTDEELSLCVATGIAEWWLLEHPEDRHVTTRGRLAAAIALPELALREAIGRLGADAARIACEFVVPVDFVADRMQTVKPARGSGARYRFGCAS